MDPDLRAYLEAITTRMDSIEQRAVARDAATRKTLDSMRAEMAAMNGKIDKTREALEAQVAATRGALEAKIDEARREAGAMFESLVHEIKALPEGLSTFQHQEAERIAVAREQDLMDRHILPLEASAADHEKRIKAMEKRR